MGPEDTQQRILELDILCILGSKGVTEIGALYKVSPSKFILVFRSNSSRKKLLNTEICSRFGDLDIQLDFHKRISPLRNGKEPTFVTIYLPEFISDQAVKLTFSNFADVVSVFKGRHKFNKNIRNGKRHIKMFQAEGNPVMLPRKITFHGNITRDALFVEKVVMCNRCRTHHMLGKNCPVVTPTPEDLDMSTSDQCTTPQESMSPEQSEPSVDISPSEDSRQDSSPLVEGSDGGASLSENSSLDRNSVTPSEVGADGGSDLRSISRPEVSSEVTPSLPSPKNFPVTQKTQIVRELASSRELGTNLLSKGNKITVKSTKHESPEPTVCNRKTYRLLIHFPYDSINIRSHIDNGNTSILNHILVHLDDDKKSYVLNILEAADETLKRRHRGTETYLLCIKYYPRVYTKENPNKPKPSPKQFDDYLYQYAELAWPDAINKIRALK